MEKTHFADRHPYWFIVILEIVVIVVYLVAGTIAHFLNLSSMGLYGLANFGLTIIVAILLTVMGWWKAVGFRAPTRGKDLLYFLVPFIPMVTNFIPGLEITSFRYALEIFVIMLMVGFVEESIFRGLMLHALKPHGLWKAVIITALLFGVTHALNSLTGKSVVEDVIQICFALAFGITCAALVLRKGILWPLVLAHWFINFIAFLQRPGASWYVWIIAIVTVILAVYGIFVMMEKEQAIVTQA